jgi:hypothetical protein
LLHQPISDLLVQALQVLVVIFALALVWGIVRLCVGDRSGRPLLASARRPRYSKQTDGPREDGRQRQQDAEAHRANPAGDPCWQVLGVSPQASPEEITRCYRQALRMYHPDRLVGLAPELVALAEKRTKELNAAFSQAKRLRNGIAR